MLSSRRQRCTHWIALLAIWVAALAPTLSAAMARAGLGAGLEVCTTSGMQSLPALLVDADGAVSEPSDGTGGLLSSLDHCGYCLLVAHLAPPSAALTPSVPATSAVPQQPAALQPQVSPPA